MNDISIHFEGPLTFGAHLHITSAEPIQGLDPELLI